MSNNSSFMMKKDASLLEFTFALTLTLLLMAFVVSSLNYGPQDRMVPLAIGIPTFLFSILIVLSYISHTADRVNDIFNQTVFAQTGDLSESETEIIDDGIWRAFSWLLVITVLFYLFGNVLTAFIFTHIYLTREGEHETLRSALIAIAAAAAILVVFEILLERELYPGVVIETILDILGLQIQF